MLVFVWKFEPGSFDFHLIILAPLIPESTFPAAQWAAAVDPFALRPSMSVVGLRWRAWKIPTTLEEMMS